MVRNAFINDEFDDFLSIDAQLLIQLILTNDRYLNGKGGTNLKAIRIFPQGLETRSPKSRIIGGPLHQWSKCLIIGVRVNKSDLRGHDAYFTWVAECQSSSVSELQSDDRPSSH
jgi:hypothetical protein